MKSFNQRIVLPYFIFTCFSLLLSFGLDFFDSTNIFMESSLFFAITFSLFGFIYLQILKLSLTANPSKAIGFSMFGMMIKFFLRTAVIFMFMTLKSDFKPIQIFPAIFWLVAFVWVEVWITGRLGEFQLKK
ncbi:MAG: hypothetical protein KBF31_04000 [Chitinophagales bacterium]|nr:hypothetical protein [Chitinophagales bacterium]